LLKATMITTPDSKAVASPMTRRKSRKGGFFARTLPFWLLLPSLIFIIFVQLYPGIYTFYLSLNNIESGARKFVGSQNFTRVFGSADFRESIVLTAIFLVGYVMLALVLNRKMKWSPLYITLIFIPWVLSDVIVGYVWKLYVDPGAGLLTQFFASPIFGLNGQPLLIASPPPQIVPDVPFPPAPAMLYLIGAAAWKALPFTTLLLLAALQTVPKEIVESSRIDGASAWNTFWLITMPLILPTILVALFNLTLGGMNGVGMVFSLTGGGPGTATEVLSYLLYIIGFSRIDFGQAAALSVFIFVINLTLIIISLRVSRSRAELI
jgi:multiple sugar transport system permease protein